MNQQRNKEVHLVETAGSILAYSLFRNTNAQSAKLILNGLKYKNIFLGDYEITVTRLGDVKAVASKLKEKKK